MKHEILIGQVDYSVLVFIPDSASTDGSGKTGLVAANLTAGYTRVETDNDVVHTDGTSSLNDLAALTTAHTDWGLKEVSSALAPGLYRLDLPDGVFVSGAWSAVVYVMVTTSAAAASPMEFTFIGIDKQAAAWPANVTQFGGSAGTFAAGIPETKVASIAANAITVTAIAADAITDAKVASDVTIASVTGAVGSVTGAVGSVTGLTAADVGAIKAKTDNLPTDPADQSLVIAATDAIVTAVATRASQASLDVVDGIVDDILLDTAEIGTAGAGLTNIDLPNQTMNITGNLTGNVSGSVGSVTGAVGSVTAGVTLAASAVQAIWDALTSALTTVGSIGKLLVDNINATISSRLASASYTTPPTVGAIADQVWEEAIADHSGTAGSTAEALGAAGSAGDPWTTALPGAYSSGQAGKIVGDNLNATVGSRATQVSVDDLPTNAELATSQAAADDATLAAVAALNNLSAAGVRTELATELGRIDATISSRATPAQVNTEADTALADVGLTSVITGRIDAAVSTRATPAQVQTELGTYDAPTKAELDAAVASVLADIAALNDISAADVNAQMLDVFVTDTFAEPGAVPAATASLKDKIGWLAVLARNRITQTATTQTLRNDANSADIATAAVSDDGTTGVKAEWA